MIESKNNFTTCKGIIAATFGAQEHPPSFCSAFLMTCLAYTRTSNKAAAFGRIPLGASVAARWSSAG